MNGGRFLQVVPNSDVTSGDVFWFDQTEKNTVAETEIYEDGFFRFFSERIAFTGLSERSFICNRLPQIESASTIKFNTNLLIKSAKSHWFASRFKDTTFLLSFSQGSSPSGQEYKQPNIAIEGPPDEDWIVQSWSVNPSECQLPSIPDDLSILSDNLNGLLSGLNSAISLSRPKELKQMAEKVASQISERENENIESWADRLANQLAKFSD